MQWTLTDMEREVRWVRDQLAAGTLPGEFNMQETLTGQGCGSVGCIGGWAVWHRHAEAGKPIRCLGDQQLMLSEVCGQVMADHFERGNALEELFFGFTGVPNVGQTVAACDRWLSGDIDNPWEEA